MKQFSIFLLIAITINGCKYYDKGISNRQRTTSDQSASAAVTPSNGSFFKDGAYCATLQYDSADSHISTCNLSVEVKNSELIKIDSLDCDCLDEIHFAATKLNKTGSAAFTGDGGGKYIITINDKLPLGSKKFQCDICGKEIR